MTYREKYLKCETEDELLEVMEKDIRIAKLINTDRIPVIMEIDNEVLYLNFK